ncbi:acyltransferase [Streptomyces sp. NPDC056002]|uniref:acyltransferase n=1 Tax=Streptomyces sp. NPDC056002 TaxID=3345675 RepID=UPI0035D60477
MTSEECAEAATAALDQADEDQAKEDAPTPTGDLAQLEAAEVEVEPAAPGATAVPAPAIVPAPEGEPEPAGESPQLDSAVVELESEVPEVTAVPASTHKAVPVPVPVPVSEGEPAPVPEGEPDSSAAVVRVPGYASGSLVEQIQARVLDVLNWEQGDVEAAQAALIKSAIPDVMALFERSRVGGRYAHSKFPPTDDILKKKSQKGADEIWEGRPKWRNKAALDAVKKSEQIEVTTLDMNAAYLSAFKCWLPIGKLVEDTSGVHDPKRSGVYEIIPPAWEHAGLPNPVGNRKEPGPVWVPDSLVRLLLDCAKWGLCEAPVIHRAMLSGATENLLEKLRRALAESRKSAIAEDDEVTVEYVKSMYSKFVSTIGESVNNTEIRRPDWMHIIRSKAFTNLWRKAYKAHTSGLTVVEISGTDELHVAGDWRPVFPEGRDLNQVKAKNIYMLGGKR